MPGPRLQPGASSEPSEERRKKRKKSSGDGPSRKERPDESSGVVNTSKPSAIYQPSKGRAHTLSIAVPGSIIANAQTQELKSGLAGQIARACAVFCVDEIVVFDDGQAEILPLPRDGCTAFADPNAFLYRTLSYLETPPYTRRALLGMKPDLRTVGALPSLDMPHHLKSNEECPFREGVTLALAPADSRAQGGTVVDCGHKHVLVPTKIDPGTRVTVDLTRTLHRDPDDPFEGDVVSPDVPREQFGYYWGYRVRRAASLSAVFTECPFDGGYDLSIGTSERGAPLSSIVSPAGAFTQLHPNWKHLIMVFGGVSGLEKALENCPDLGDAGVSQVETLFDCWVNLVPGQGSRTIRTEEAVWVGLMGVHAAVDARNRAQ